MTIEKQILANLKTKQQEMVNLLEEFTNTDSPSTDKILMDRFAELVAEKWKAAGVEVTMLPQETRGNHIKAQWGTGSESMLLLCHMDTVWDAGETVNRPFTVKDGKGYGPGAYDMKAGIVQAIFAVKTLIDLGLSPKKKIVILHNSDEEIGSDSSRTFIEEEAKKASAVLVLEPSTRGGALKTWRKGVGSLNVRIKGLASHAGADYEKGISAINEAAYKILQLHGLTDLEEGTTVNVGVIKGGTRSNVVAEEVVMEVDLRAMTIGAADAVIHRIRALKPIDSRTEISFEGGFSRPPMERNEKNLGLFHLARSVGKKLGLELEESGTGGGSDGNFTSALGIATLDGLGAVGDGAHAVTEHVVLSALPERTAVLAALMLEI